MRKWIPPLFVVILSLTLAIPFVWDLNVDTGKVSAYATLLAAILTAVTVFLLYRQNQHILDDRNAATQPDIFPLDIELYTFTRKLNVFVEDSQLIPFFVRTPVDDWNSALEIADCDIEVPIQNIGLGVAKRISCFWEYDKRKVQSITHLI